MSITDILIWAVIGIVAGWLAGVVTKTDRGIWGDLVLGLIGGLVAGLILDNVGPGNNLIWSIVAAAIVAIILVWLKNLVMGSR